MIINIISIVYLFILSVAPGHCWPIL